MTQCGEDVRLLEQLGLDTLAPGEARACELLLEGGIRMLLELSLIHI